MTTKNSERRYAHVAIVGIDGMGAFCNDTPTPCMDEIFKNGAKKPARSACSRPSAHRTGVRCCSARSRKCTA